MKKINKIILGIVFCMGSITITKGQDVIINVPVQNIFNQTEFTTVQSVMNTQGSSHWRAGGIDPKIMSMSGNNFIHTSLLGFSLPTSVLHWRLESIGGELPPFSNRDKWPGYKWFTTSNQTWYQPTISSTYTPGNIDFNFKIPSNELASHVYHAGDYSIQVTQNYGGSGFYVIEFSPDSFYVILSIPEAISWLTSNNIGYTEISSLDQYRSAPADIVLDLGTFELGNTVNFNLFAKNSSSSIQFTALDGDQETLDVSMLKLGGNLPNISTTSLSLVEQNFTPGNSFSVENGNRNSFQLHTSLSRNDFKNHFFRAGDYKFQLNLNAKSLDNSIATQQNIDYTLKVLPLSEIRIPNGTNTINFEFNTAAQYQNGQTKLINNQLEISNNQNFEIYVKSDVPYFNRAGIQSDISASILQIGVENGDIPVTLSTTPQKIINNGTPVLDKNLDIKYVIPSESAQSLISKESDTYSINVIYSFTAL